MQREIVFSWLLLVAIAIIALSRPTDAAPYPAQNYWGQMEEEDPEAMLELLARLGGLRAGLVRNRDLENTKRGFDLGLGRGMSASQAAKHLMGLTAANFAGGPGRRRRSEQV